MKDVEKKSIKLFILILAGFSVHIGAAQVRVQQNGANTELYFVKTANTSTYDKVIGTPYLYEDFVQAKVNELEKTYFVRFNMSNGNIEFKNEEGVAMILDNSDDYLIRVLDGSNKEYETQTYIDDKGKEAKMFFERIEQNDKYILFMREVVVYIPAKEAKNSFEQSKPAKFTRAKGVYYYKSLLNKDAVLTALPKREKLFIKHFGNQENNLKKFIKEERLHIDSKKDIIQILNYYFNLP